MERFAALTGLEKVLQKPQLNAGGAWTLPDGSVLVQTLCSTGSTTPASRPASGSRPACWSASRGNGPATRTAGTPRRPTPSWSPPPAPARSSRCPTRPRREGAASRPGGSRPAPSAWSATRGPPASCWASPRSSSTATATTAGPSTTSSARSSTSASSRARCPGGARTGPGWSTPTTRRHPLEARVKSYLHVNCSACHVNEGGGNSRMELDLDSSPRRMSVIDAVPIHDRFGIPDARLVAPGSPERSVLYRRISTPRRPARCRPWCPPRSTARPSS